ncbi:hypothetical protein HDU83_009952 [Entophlyctis luteolus]|nr:hypothetical protein HDU83_009952 [Entophlyctis luteolus]
MYDDGFVIFAPHVMAHSAVANACDVLCSRRPSDLTAGGPPRHLVDRLRTPPLPAFCDPDGNELSSATPVVAHTEEAAMLSAVAAALEILGKASPRVADLDGDSTRRSARDKDDLDDGGGHNCIQEDRDDEDDNGHLLMLTRAAVQGAAALHHCASSLIIAAAARLAPPYCPFPNELSATELLFLASVRFMDAWKVDVFHTVWIAPTQFIFDAVYPDEENSTSVEVHGSNLYLALIDAMLGIKCLKSPYLQDSVKGVFPFLNKSLVGETVHDFIFAHISDPSNIGKPIPMPPESFDLVRAAESFIAPADSLFAIRDDDVTYTVEKALADILSDASSVDALQPYMRVFASYFSGEVVLEPLWLHLVESGLIESVVQPIFELFSDLAASSHLDRDGEPLPETNYLSVKAWVYDCRGYSSERSFRPDRFKQLLDFVGLTNVGMRNDFATSNDNDLESFCESTCELREISEHSGTEGTSWSSGSTLIGGIRERTVWPLNAPVDDIGSAGRENDEDTNSEGDDDAWPWESASSADDDEAESFV